MQTAALAARQIADELLLITTVPTMILAQQGIPNLWLVLATLVGGALSAGSANAFNCYIDADIDKIMGRTKGRPLVTGELSKTEAFVFAWVIGIGSVLWLGLLVNWMASMLSLIAILFYVFVYTLLLKRRTEQNIVWGGAAGCMPVLIAWSAVTGGMTMTPVILFLIVFFWTPPHYWPLAMKYKDDYERAGIPMLPVLKTSEQVTDSILRYSWVMVLVSLALIPIAPMGPVYDVAAVILGGVFLYEAYRLRSAARSAAARPDWSDRQGRRRSGCRLCGPRDRSSSPPRTWRFASSRYLTAPHWPL